MQSPRPRIRVLGFVRMGVETEQFSDRLQCSIRSQDKKWLLEPMSRYVWPKHQTVSF